MASVVVTIYYILFAFSFMYSMYFAITGLFGFKNYHKSMFGRHKPKHKFGIIIACRNEEQVIGALIKSLKKQRYPEKLYEIYCQNNRIKKPWGILGDTFDEKLFYPKKQERGKGNEDSSFVIGWVGNSAWNHKLRDENGKQIVISSDRPPRDIPLLEERLKSRFEWGILADISLPDYETRLAILRKKVQADNIIIDDYILSVIATKVDSNIRELEGALNKIVAYASLTHSPITIEMTEKAINDIVLQKEKVISADYIQDIVAKYFNIDKKDLISTKKSNDIVYPRQIAMYLCRAVGQMSFPKIAEEFKKKDHTTVMHAYKKIEKDIKENSNTKLIVESVKNIIKDSK